MNINKEINILVNYAIKHKYIDSQDRYYSINTLLDLLGLEEFKDSKDNALNCKNAINNMISFALKNKIIKNDKNEINVFESKLFGAVIGSPSYIVNYFNSLKGIKATNWLKELNIFTKYIDMEKINNNIKYTWDNDLNITINTVKPEIRKVTKAKRYYPLTVISKENEGYVGGASYNLRKTHRIIPLKLDSNKWYFQFSPYNYLNNHGIVFTDKLIPMLNNKILLKETIDFVELFPFFSVCSNSDKIGTGVSIPYHKHFQVTSDKTPIENSKSKKIYSRKGVDVFDINWYIGSFKLVSKNKNQIIEEATTIINTWKKLKIPNINFVNNNNNTISLLVKKQGTNFIIYILFRNNSFEKNSKTQRVFDVPKHLSIIKKEGIGIIEAIGCAILPGRLINELKKVNSLNAKDWSDWKKWIKENTNIKNIEKEWKNALGHTFKEILKNVNVFKNSKELKKYFIDCLIAAKK